MYYLILTSLTVSLDSFACGFSLAKDKNNSIAIVSIISLTVFVMCLTLTLFAKIVMPFFNLGNTFLGGIILILVGLINLLKNDEETLLIKSPENSDFYEILLVGFAVGVDGAIASLSLFLMGYNSLFVPVVLAVMHGVMVSAGIMISASIRKIKKINLKFLSALVLCIMGYAKLF